MTAARLRTVFWIDAAFSAIVGVLFLAGSWDGLYDALDLPQGRPAIFVQIGGAVLLGMAYLLWLATRTIALMVPVARASAIVTALSAVTIVAWLIHGGLHLGTLGDVLLIAAATLLVALTVAYLAAGLRPGGYGPQPPPAPEA
jgi:hypothetical protein